MTELKPIDQYAARLLMVSFFLPARWQVFAVMAVCVCFIFRSWQTRQHVKKSDFGWAVLFGTLFLIFLVAVPFTPVEFRKFLLHLCERKVSLLFIPLVFAFSGSLVRKALESQLMYFVYGCIISCLAGNLDFMYHYYFCKGGLHELSHVAYRIIFEKFTGIHPTYMGLFLGLSICIILLNKEFNYQNGKKIKYLLFYILSLFLLSLLAKSALIAMVVIFVHYAYMKRAALFQHKLRLAGMAVALVAACFFIPFISQRSKEVLSYLGIGKPGTTADNSVYVRKMILDTDLSLLKANWLTGVGPGRVLHLLRQRYFFYSLAHNNDVSFYDPHNEYLSDWLSFGIAGILLFAMILVIHFRKAIVAGNHLYLYCMILVCTTFFTETVLSRQEGVLFFAIFTSLFFFGSDLKKGEASSLFH